jgi:hypothetical protein
MPENEIFDTHQEQVTIPAIVQEAAASAQLGNFQKVYPFIIKSIGKSLFLHTGCLGIGILLILCGISGIGHTGLLPYFVAAIPIVLGGFPLLLDLYDIIFKPNIRREDSIYEFEDGIVSLKGGDRVEVFPWTQIAFLWRDIISKGNACTIGNLWEPQLHNHPNLPVEHLIKVEQSLFTESLMKAYYNIQSYQRKRLTIHYGYEGNIELGNRIENKVVGRLLPQAKQDLEEGRVVQFGYFKISQHAISAGKRTLLWEQVGEFSVSITIKRQGTSPKWAHRAVSDIPNFTVFRKIVEAMLQHDQQSSAVKKKNRRRTRQPPGASGGRSTGNMKVNIDNQ